MTDLARNSIAVIVSLAIVVIAIAGVRYFFFRQPLLPIPPAPAVTAVLSPSPMPSPPTSPTPEVTATVPESSPTSAQESEVAKIVTLEADDLGFYPSNTVTAKAGNVLTLLFKVRTTNVYYGGLQIESSVFDTGPVKPGGMVSTDFVVPKGTTIFTSYWPYQKVKKAEGEIIGE